MFLLAALSLAWAGITAQTYWREEMDTVPHSGYYNVEISREISGLGLETLKIVDKNGKEVPFFIRASVPVREIKQLEMYELHSNAARDSVNTIIIKNKGGEVSRLYLLMKKADVSKSVSLRGSNNLRQWYGVRHRSALRSEQNPNLGEIAVVDVPQGDYAYYEITVINSSGSPLDITGVGRMEESSIYGQFAEINLGEIIIEDDKYQNTIITMPRMRYPYYLCKLEMQVTGKGHYSRRARIHRDNYSPASFRLSSKEENIFYFDEILIDNETQIIIENQDNPPLTIENIRMYSIKRYLCAYLEEGTRYHIETSGKKYKRYDIQGFANDIPQDLPIVKTSHLVEITPETAPGPEPGFFESPLFLWGVIILLGGLLVLVCVRMLNDLRSKG